MDEAGFRDAVSPWPGVTLDWKWQDNLVASIDSRMFAVWVGAGAHAGALCFKVPDEDFLAWTARPGVRPAPYLARARWVMLPAPADHPADTLTAALRGAYDCIAGRLSRRRRQALGLG